MPPVWQQQAPVERKEKKKTWKEVKLAAGSSPGRDSSACIYFLCISRWQATEVMICIPLHDVLKFMHRYDFFMNVCVRISQSLKMIEVRRQVAAVMMDELVDWEAVN